MNPLILSIEGCCTFFSDGSHQWFRQAKEDLILQLLSKCLLSSRHSWSTSAAGTSLRVNLLIPCSRCRGNGVVRSTPSLRARLSGLCWLDIFDSHLAQVHRPHGHTLLVIGFLCGFDVELLQEEGDELRVGKRSFPLVSAVNPSI